MQKLAQLYFAYGPKSKVRKVPAEKLLFLTADDQWFRSLSAAQKEFIGQATG
jgi:hypothetical protein